MTHERYEQQININIGKVLCLLDTGISHLIL